jgi:hypothetical protein
MSLRSELRVKLSVTILHKNDVWSLPPVVCSKAHVLFTLFVFVYDCVQHILFLYCFTFLRFVYPMLPVSMDCLFIITSSVSSHIYLHVPYSVFIPTKVWGS